MISAARDRVTVVLDFDVGASRYRIARTLKRNGAQMVRLEEHDGVGGKGSRKNLADQVRTATDQMVRILGLGAPAFLQAVVLPQGEFARFLRAQPRDRRSMLRTLLRLDVYERMRERAQRSAAAKKGTVDSLLKLLADEYAGIDESTVAGLETEHTRVALSLEAARKRRDDAQATLTRLRGQQAKTRELREVEERRAALEKQAEQVSRERESRRRPGRCLCCRCSRKRPAPPPPRRRRPRRQTLPRPNMTQQRKTGRRRPGRKSQRKRRLRRSRRFVSRWLA